LFKNKKFRARSRHRNLTHGIESIRVQTAHAERKNSVTGDQDDDKDTLLSAEPSNFSRIRNKYSVVNSGKFVINIRTLWLAEITMIKPQARKKIFDVGRVGPLPGCIQ
jgi:hypothetical protein